MLLQILNLSALLVMIVLATMILYFAVRALVDKLKHKPIKVGIIHSLTGTMAISEVASVNAMKLAIEDINILGGLLGRKVKPIVVDGASDPNIFKKQAEYLIKEEKVSVIFGCWRSDCRKAVKLVVEKYDHLLVYPISYEGLESSKNIIYTGITSNQQILPSIKWAFDNLGKHFFLVGSDYVFSRTANAIIQDQVKALGGEVVGEQYIVLGSTNVEHVTSEIARKKPDVIIHTINGDTNIHFFKSLRQRGVKATTTPTLSFSISEAELNQMNLEDFVGDYAAWSYFQSIPSSVNQEFIDKYKARYGKDKVTADNIESGYISVMIWADSVNEAKTTDTRVVRRFMSNQHYFGASGRVHIEQQNNHIAKAIRIGKVMKNGQIDIIWSSEKVILPNPYPDFRTKTEWHAFLDNLYHSWGEKWLNVP